MSTATATMVRLAAPSRGSADISTWRIRMTAEGAPLSHVIDRDQIWMPITGRFEFTVAEQVSVVEAGQALVVPGGQVRSFRVVEGEAEALVAMRPDGMAQRVGSDAWVPVPWAG